LDDAHQLRKVGGQQRTGDGNSAVWTLRVGLGKDGGMFESTSPVGRRCPGGAWAEKPFLGGRQQFGEIVLQAGHDEQGEIPGVVQEGGSGELPVDDHIVGFPDAAAPVNNVREVDPP